MPAALLTPGDYQRGGVADGALSPRGRGQLGVAKRENG